MSRFKMSRSLTALISIVLVLALLSSCAGSTAAPTTAATAATTAAEATTAETTAAATTAAETTAAATTAETQATVDPFFIEGAEGITFTYWSTMQNYQSEYFTTMAEHPYFKWLKEKTGINIEFIHPSAEQRDQQLTLMIASKEFYDFLESPWYPGGPQAGINEKCFIDLLPYLDQYMPNYKLALYDTGNALNSWEWSDAERAVFKPQPQLPAFAEKLFTFDGQLWAMTDVWRDQIPPSAGPIIRRDWLKEAGLAMPETLGELETVLAAFKKKGVIPMALPALGYSSLWDGAALLSAFDTGGYFDMGMDGKTIEDHTYIKDGFKKYLALLRDWYAKGYIDPDFMNSDWDSTWSKMVEDKLGIWLNFYGGPDDVKGAYLGTQAFDLAAMPAPRISKDQILRAKQGYVTETTNWLTITTSCKHPEIAAQWMDKSYTKEAMLRQSYGVEGETYKMADGVPVYLDSFFTDEKMPSAVKQQTVLKVIGPHYYSTRASILLGQKGDNTKPGTLMEASMVWDQNSEMKLRIPYTIFEDDDWGVQENLVTEVSTYANPMIIKFITGQEDLDAKWDEYVKTCIDLGIREAKAVWQKAYDKMTAGK
jgi:putative aldouronate transport system substrate-binding protein